jgi:hypothetical protein
MAKTRKMSPSMDAWRKHVAKVASAEGVKYGDAMKMANKGKYASEWKQIQASVSKSKKGGAMPALNPAEVHSGGGDPNPYNEQSGPAVQSAGKRRRSRKSRKTRRSKRGGAVLV